jgi:hypothetical protein
LATLGSRIIVAAFCWSTTLFEWQEVFLRCPLLPILWAFQGPFAGFSLNPPREGRPRTRTEWLALPVSSRPRWEAFLVCFRFSVKGTFCFFSHQLNHLEVETKVPDQRYGAWAVRPSTSSWVVHMWMVGGEFRGLLHQVRGLSAPATWGKPGSPQAVPSRPKRR